MPLKRADEIRPGDRWTDGGGVEWMIKSVDVVALHGRSFVELAMDPTDRDLLLMPIHRDRVARWFPTTKLQVH